MQNKYMKLNKKLRLQNFQHKSCYKHMSCFIFQIQGVKIKIPTFCSALYISGTNWKLSQSKVLYSTLLISVVNNYLGTQKKMGKIVYILNFGKVFVSRTCLYCFSLISRKLSKFCILFYSSILQSIIFTKIRLVERIFGLNISRNTTKFV